MATTNHAAGQPIGTHILIDVVGDADFSDPRAIERILREAADRAGAKTLDARFHHFGEEMGVTGFLLLAESHISIHTWPEHRFAAIDMFICGSPQTDSAIDWIKEAFAGCDVNIRNFARGSTVADLGPKPD